MPEDTNSDAESAYSSVSQALEGEDNYEYNSEQDTGAVKNWNFPKIHTHQHCPDDVRGKGVSKGYNTKPYEKMHGQSKKIYAHQTNFRDFVPQVSFLNTILARVYHLLNFNRF
jgi:hypothetical protein